MKKICKKSLVNIVLFTWTACNIGSSIDKQHFTEINRRYNGLRRDNYQLLLNTLLIKNNEIDRSEKLSLVPYNVNRLTDKDYFVAPDIKIKKTRYNATFNKRSY
ncbi:MAG TPA: hypothetical protein VN040_20480 [Pseudosphingobacterium sp.]|nr:hypothetical protein [Pseudosphingobacterium sp.]